MGENGVSREVGLTRSPDEFAGAFTREVVGLDKEGKVQRLTPVVGFLKRQHYGPNNSLVKTIFVEPHERQAWVNEGLRIIKVTK